MTFRLFSPICESKETRKCDTNHTTNYVMNTVKYSQNEPRNTMKRFKILGEEGEGGGRWGRGCTQRISHQTQVAI